jgi:small subunit ribosomal protein S3
MTIERKFIQQNLKELQIKSFILQSLGKVGVAHVKLQRTPLGEKILISCSRPGLVVGRAGSNIQRLTTELKQSFGLENPQIEIEELTNPMLEASILAEMISNSMERFGTARFKGIGHKAMTEAMRSGALGVEILISGKVPSQRAKTWRFYNGYLKKCGDVAVEGVDISYRVAVLKTGVVGIKVSVMPPTTILPDRIDILDVQEIIVEEVTGKDEAADIEEKVDEAAPKKPARKKAVKKEGDEKKPARKKAAKKEAVEPAEPESTDAPAESSESPESTETQPDAAEKTE